jgi:hypothetical protein
VTPAILPASQPRQTRDRTEFLLAAAGVSIASSVALLGVRGYYLNTMGAAKVNDRGIYDDAIFVCSPDVHASFNANTDPSIARVGVAVLEPGVWEQSKGKHRRSDPKGYPALIQASEVVVRRDGTEALPIGTKHPKYGVCVGVGLWRGWFGINTHRGSSRATSSLGCQTIYPSQWDAFLALVYSEMTKWDQAQVKYLLVDNA